MCLFIVKRKDPAYKEYVARLIVEEGRTARELSHELKLPYSTIRKWAVNYKAKQERHDDPQEQVTLKELDDIKKQIEALREENEILKKAMHIFNKNQE